MLSLVISFEVNEQRQQQHQLGAINRGSLLGLENSSPLQEAALAAEAEAAAD